MGNKKIEKNVQGRWTDEQIRLLQRLYPTAAWEELKKSFPKFSRHAIRSKAIRVGLKRKKEDEALLRDRMAEFLHRARTSREITIEFGNKAHIVVDELCKNPPEGLRMEKGTKGVEPTWYLARIPTKSVKVQPRLFTIRPSKNDPDYLRVEFPPEHDFDTKTNELRIWPIDSVHVGDPLCDEEKFGKYLRYLDKKNSFAVIVGDFVGVSGYNKKTAPEIRQNIKRMLAPYAHKIIAAQSGCTEEQLTKVDGINPLEYVCRELNIHHTSRPIRLDVTWKFPLKPIEFYILHGRSNAIKPGSQANTVIDIAAMENYPHYTILGHLKHGFVNTLTARRIDERALDINEHPAFTIICPGFQKYEGSLTEKKGQRSAPVGTIVCIIGDDNSHSASS